MIDVYVLDKNLELVGIVDSYKSLIWAKRYYTPGDCEIYVEATPDMISLLRSGYYLARGDDDMVCQIRKIEIDTSADDGNYLIVTGYDTKIFLDQRVVWSMANCDGNLEDFIRQLVQNSCVTPALSGRAFLKENGTPLLKLGNRAGFTEAITEQVSYKNVGEKVREYCQTYKWGYRFVPSDGLLWFQLYKGADRSNTVIFSDSYENLSSTKYVEDGTNMGNVALVAGAGEGSARSRNVYGYDSSTSRFEIFVDAKDIAKVIKWEELTKVYPTTDSGGQGYIARSGRSYVYKLNYLNIQIVDSNQLTWLQTNFPSGQVVTISGNRYYQVYNEIVADLPSNAPDSNADVTLRDMVYSVYLLNRGAEKTAAYGLTTTFEGSVIPDVTFVYKRDYFLGDIVSVENEYGITATPRIVEVVEVMDENGYRVEPKFEKLEVQ